MASVTFVIDESGAKGYSDNREERVGELGVIAGFFVPEEHIPKLESDIGAIARQYLTEGKLHITDMDSQDQELFRNQVLSYLLSVRASWTYEAMYVEGLHSYAQLAHEFTDAAKSARRSKVEISSNEKLDLLHAELFLGAFGKAIAFCTDSVGRQFHLNVITDRIDRSILRHFQEKAQQLLSVGEKKVQTVTGFDPDADKMLSRSISSEITQGQEVLGDFSGVTFEISISESVLTLAADVLANSVHYHLSSLQEATLGYALNTQEAIKNHQLSSIVYGVSGIRAESPQVSDTIFRHPSQS